MAQQPSPLTAALTRELGKYTTLDPKAVLAVAQQEGLGGGVGDQGTSFGPFQLHEGGALPSGIANPQQWAWSPAGLDYALSRIQGVAGGLKGAPAVQNIVSRFERPANVSGEISRALSAYGLPAQGGSQIGGGATPAGPSAASVSTPDNRPAFARALTGAISPTGQLSNPLALVQALQTLRGG